MFLSFSSYFVKLELVLQIVGLKSQVLTEESEEEEWPDETAIWNGPTQAKSIHKKELVESE